MERINEGIGAEKSDFMCASVACSHSLDASVFMLIGNGLGNESKGVVIMNLIVYPLLLSVA